MMKGYLGCLQCSPKDGMIPNRVRHLFIFLACLYPLPPEPFVVFLPSRVFGKDIHPSFLQQSSDPSSSADVISLVVQYMVMTLEASDWWLFPTEIHPPL